MKIFENLVMPEHLLLCFDNFVIGKRKRHDIILFERNLADNIFDLSSDLRLNKYKHGSYKMFAVHDPKPRVVCVAAVRDRLVHQIIFEELVSQYEPQFFGASYASRFNRGSWRAVDKLEKYLRFFQRTKRQMPFVLHLDVEKFFASVDHQILLKLLFRKRYDDRFKKILEEVVGSYNLLIGKGMPLGNVTSQIFANIYLHEVDHFIVQKLKHTHYVRYNDDLFLVGDDAIKLDCVAQKIVDFVVQFLCLTIPKSKILLRRWDVGVDLLGVVSYPNYRVPRARLRKKIVLLLKNKPEYDWRNVVSYIGLLQQSRGFILKTRLAIQVK